jgi:hypothetical protein
VSDCGTCPAFGYDCEYVAKVEAQATAIKRLREALRGMVEYSRFNERWQDAHPEYVKNSIRALGETE